jgi:hypothetical protein
MRAGLDLKRIDASRAAAWFIPVILFWLVLAFEIPSSFTRYFHQFFSLLFLGVLFLFYLAFRLKGILAFWRASA